MAGPTLVGLSMLISWRGKRRETEYTAAELGNLEPDQVEELDATSLTSAERKAIRQSDRGTWRTPARETLERPTFSTGRMAGMLASARLPAARCDPGRRGDLPVHHRITRGTRQRRRAHRTRPRWRG
ncbi:hypothetical protein [Nocardia aurantiaca]|uniref:Uncharacterized protein n=1 Tax=Nocardia aurantiaca TaxID=2675850 RepID=A0A6I3KTY7_9NOCA|nr:hypothetical protein [Nocardia aurantiaca]MTE12506.1 hypothetical protein [Nocardia aurantiaca]